MDERLLTIQDVSCVGQCSLTVALPVISACGIETAVLPSSVLSNHTAFSSWTFCDLTDQLPVILDEWKKQHIDFSAFYTGYVSAAQIPLIKRIIAQSAREGSRVFVDPVMADNGKMYAGFGSDFPQKMAELCRVADYVLPNITEACFLLGEDYPGDTCSESFVERTCKGLLELGAKCAVLTGVSFRQEELGVALLSVGSDRVEYYFAPRLPAQMHGTGDVFASVFAGAILRGKSALQAATLAADVVVQSIKATLDDKADHWYGVKFEKAIPYLVSRLS